MNVTIKSDAAEHVPVILILTGGDDENTKIIQCLENHKNQAAFVFINGFDWNRDLSLWPAPAVWKDTPDFSGGANEFLYEIINGLLPQLPNTLGFEPTWYGIAGYSLAGLFAVYSLYLTDVFRRAVSASGSMWYDGFCDFALNNEFAGKPDRIYFSLGNRESRTRNQKVAATEDNTRTICGYYQNIGIRTVFEMNPGNHFQNPPGRLAKGIRWILEN